MIKILIFLIISFVVFLIVKYINEIEKFEKVGREEIYNNEKENLDNKFVGKDPKDFGFEFEEIETIENGKKRKAFFIQSKKDTKKVIFFVHGRKSNVTRNLKYLNILKEEVFEDYSILFADMRNSGESYKARTYMGYKVADDIEYWVEYLKRNKGLEEVIFYSFSMGAMATSIYLDRHHNEEEVKINKIIFDSPLVNVKKNIMHNVEESKLKKIFLEMVLYVFNMRVGGELKKMSFSKLLKERKEEILIMQSKEDNVTSYEILIDEIKNMDNIKISEFDSGKHVQIYSGNEKMYKSLIEEFIRK